MPRHCVYTYAHIYAHVCMNMFTKQRHREDWCIREWQHTCQWVVCIHTHTYMHMCVCACFQNKGIVKIDICANANTNVIKYRSCLVVVCIHTRVHVYMCVLTDISSCKSIWLMPRRCVYTAYCIWSVIQSESYVTVRESYVTVRGSCVTAYCIWSVIQSSHSPFSI